MFETLMTTIKTKVVSAEFRSATVSRMQAMFQMMARRARTNQSEFDSADNVANGGEAKPKAAEPAREEAKTIGDVFASMMSQARGRAPAPMMQAQPAAGAAPKSQVGRNDPCPCGSGKKYKKCCGRGLV